MKTNYLALIMLLLTTCAFAQTKKTSQNQAVNSTSLSSENKIVVLDTVFYTSMRLECHLDSPQNITIVVKNKNNEVVDTQETNANTSGVFKIGIPNIAPGKYILNILGSEGKLLYNGEIEKLK
ncbi:DUF3244 domain-containing protein [Flavobacterium sp. MK4S-17]|uniref:DUF3244 domain-containing protein n=1 Tax=Flavobacterium sp. MK4S-17 TaxID=2543737 RepID=UPI00135B05C0|nr:DUF3244 domain-containing protein [Flavobacterium sp. MK4S-17]